MVVVKQVPRNFELVLTSQFSIVILHYKKLISQFDWLGRSSTLRTLFDNLRRETICFYMPLLKIQYSALLLNPQILIYLSISCFKQMLDVFCGRDQTRIVILNSYLTFRLNSGILFYILLFRAYSLWQRDPPRVNHHFVLLLYIEVCCVLTLLTSAIFPFI